jgi:hypothetical protein
MGGRSTSEVGGVICHPSRWRVEPIGTRFAAADGINQAYEAASRGQQGQLDAAAATKQPDGQIT